MPPIPTSRLAQGLLVFVAVLVGFRYWTSYCFFPLPEWNNVRLAASFMLGPGLTPYADQTGGPLSTWTYGPIPLLFNWPATLAGDAITATLAAGIINLLTSLIPVAIVVQSLGAGPAGVSRLDRLWILLLCLALWPNWILHYLHADNVAVACGLISNWLLSRRRDPEPSSLLGAAFFTSLAVWSKQPILFLVFAQCGWLMVTAGFRLALRFALTTLGIGLFIGLLTVAYFGFSGPWLNLVELPSRFRWTPDFVERARVLGDALLRDAVLPAVGLILFRRHVWTKDSPWLLPALTWSFLLPMGLMATFKEGGSSNSLCGSLFLVIPAAHTLVALLQRHRPRSARPWTAAVIAAVLLQQLGSSHQLPLRPLTSHLEDAAHLASKFPQQIYFPWHPLITWYSEGRFYHTEDGLFVWSRCGLPLSVPQARAHLPPQWSMTAVQGWRENGVFRRYQPSSAQLGAYGKWSLFYWKPPGAPVSP